MVIVRYGEEKSDLVSVIEQHYRNKGLNIKLAKRGERKNEKYGCRVYAVERNSESAQTGNGISYQ